MAEENRVTPFPRGIHTYALRAGRMTESQRRSFETLASRYCVPCDGKPVLDFPAIFGREARIVVEIGFGMGISTAAIAESDPGTDFLGIEVHTPGVGKLLSEIEARGLRNIRILHHDAVEVVAEMLLPESVDGFHIFFPDPWPKKRHHKRRLVRRPFTELLVSRLKPGGYIHFMTDWSEYADFALAELSSTPGLSNVSGSSWTERTARRPVTKFEQRAEKEGRQVLEIRMVRTA
ncbi:MAG: tRNA (guanosine(46)-N7)-methyltransferase TrmB [Spirochaetes bacterium]|nr:tRNA (guanosine(46)-N7)-methyltransferase TrmB [Spirochaetota bacterium]